VVIDSKTGEILRTLDTPRWTGVRMDDLRATFARKTLDRKLHASLKDQMTA
jgi:hypothetical protein